MAFKIHRKPPLGNAASRCHASAAAWREASGKIATRYTCGGTIHSPAPAGNGASLLTKCPIIKV
ncbi:MAG: hypothetical protein ACFNNL_11015 [Kingella oralis]